MIKYILHYAPAKIIPGLVNFLGLMIYARIFTQEEYGRYAYVLATLGLIQSILFPWIRMSCSRFYQKYHLEGKGQEYENFTLFIFLLVSMFLSIGWTLFLTFYPVEDQLKQLYKLGLIVIISQALFEQITALIRAKLQSKLYAYSVILSALIRISSILLLVYLLKMNEISLFIGLIIAQVIPILIYLRNNFEFNKRYFKLNMLFIKETFQYGVPLTFSFLFVYIISSVDRILIEYYLGVESVGLYSIPYEFTAYSLTNIFMIFSLAFFPVLVRELEKNDKGQAQNRIKQYAEVMLSFTLPITIFMIMKASFIAKLFLGTNYSSNESILIIQLLSVASFFAGLKAYFFDFSFQLGKNTYAQIIPVLFAAGTNIIANIILIPIWGIIGAVVGTLIAYIIGIVLSIKIGYSIFPMKISGGQTIKIMIINCLLVILLHYLPFHEVTWVNLMILTFFGGLFYVILMVIFNINNVRRLLIGKISNR